MAETSTKLGRVSLVPRGEYDPSAVYDRLDVVEYNGSGYLVLADGIKGITPATGPDYMLLAERGETGPQGIPGPQGEQGVPGENGADGTSFTILGRYDTLDALKAAHPTGGEGEAWAVGSAEGNDIYLWDVDEGDWANVGSLQGPPGPQGPQGLTGPQGPEGQKGDTGSDGPQGPAGPIGAAGAPGEAGKSAYQYAVDGGYTGSEEDFTALISSGPWIPSQGRLLERNNEVFNGITYLSSVSGNYAHIEGGGHTAADGECTHIEGYGNQICAGASTEGINLSQGTHVEGSSCSVSLGGDISSMGIHVEGAGNCADTSTEMHGFLPCDGTHVEGSSNFAKGSGDCHVAGTNNHVAASDSAYVCGRNNILAPVLPNMSYPVFIFGYANTVNAGIGCDFATIIGDHNSAPGDYEGTTSISSSFAMIGSHLEFPAVMPPSQPPNAIVLMGEYNNKEQLDGRLIIGDGRGNSLSNCFRVTSTGVYASGNYNSAGADYAELFEWADGNPDGEDRIGRFVTLDGDKMRLARPGDLFVLGVVSGFPSVVGDSYDDQWQGMYQCDIYGRPIWEDVEVPEEDAGISPAGAAGKTHIKRQRKLNPDYDPEQTYVPRSQRPEWGCVGLMGKLTVVDDGSCQVDGWCAPGIDGAASHSDDRTDFRVIGRIDDTHVRILALGRR